MEETVQMVQLIVTAVAAVPLQVQQRTEMPEAALRAVQRQPEAVMVEMEQLQMEMQVQPEAPQVVAVVVPEEVTMVEL